MFTGFSDKTMEFFLDIRFHNDKSFMDAHRAEYQENVRGVFCDFIDAMAPAMLSIDPDMEVRPNKCLARINRDIRFTRDKSPYRDHLWLLFHKAAVPKESTALFWFELGPEKMNWGLGTWFENKPMMEILRRKMLAEPDAFLSLLRLPPGLTLGGESYKRMAIPAELPEALGELYVKRDIYISRPDPPMSLAFSPALVSRVTDDYRQLKPLYYLLRGCMDEAMEQAREQTEGNA